MPVNSLVVYSCWAPCEVEGVDGLHLDGCSGCWAEEDAGQDAVVVFEYHVVFLEGLFFAVDLGVFLALVCEVVDGGALDGVSVFLIDFISAEGNFAEGRCMGRV